MYRFTWFCTFILLVACLTYNGSLLMFANANEEQEILYDGYKVLRVRPETTDQLMYLQKISEESQQVFVHKKIDFWSEPNTVNDTADMMISPEFETQIKSLLNMKNLKAETIISDVGRMLDIQKVEEENSLLYSRFHNDSMFFLRFHPLTNMYQFLEDIVKAYPELCSMESIGKSSEGRSMRIIKIGYPSNHLKPMVWIDAGIHAREWIAPATALYIVNSLIKNKDDDQINQLLRTFDFHVLPSANPDGYEYSRLFDRFWRKTRSRNRGHLLGLFCIGVDPNRNYGFQWSRAGSSSNPCSNTYHGPHPFSEPETKAIADYVLSHRDRVKLFITLHSYSQLILTPWGYTREYPKDYPDLIRVAEIGSRALKMRYGTEYRFGSSTEILYAASGGADDWAHGAAGIKYSYTIELRDKGTYGFILPARYIQPTGEETYDALIAMLNEIKKEI